MKLFLRLASLAAAVALGFWLWTVFFPAPEKVIRHRLEKLAADASFTGTQGNFSRLIGGENVAGFFSTNIEININVPGQEQVTFTGRAEITQAALGVREKLKSLSVKFPDVNVALGPDKKSAVADVTLEATVSGERDAIVQELKISFQKIQGVWLITRIETVRTVAALRFSALSTKDRMIEDRFARDYSLAVLAGGVAAFACSLTQPSINSATSSIATPATMARTVRLKRARRRRSSSI